jgi:transcriptional activator
LIAEHPFDERLYRQLMLALYRAGRPGNALEVYQRARKTFDEQLGLQPGPELEELQRQILNQDGRLSAPARTPAGTVAASRRGLILVSAVALLGAAVLTGLLLWSNGGDGTPKVVPNSLVKLDPNTGEVLDVIEVGRQPVALAVVGDAVWVSNNEDATVTRVDPKTGHTDTIGGLRPPLDLVADGQQHVWISTDTYEQVTRIDARTLQKDVVVPLGRNTFLLGIGAGSLWVTETPPNLGDPGSVARINLATAKVERIFKVGPYPVDVKVGEGAAWVTNGADASVSRISLGDGSRRADPDRAYPRDSGGCVRFCVDHRRRGTRHCLETEPGNAAAGRADQGGQVALQSDGRCAWPLGRSTRRREDRAHRSPHEPGDENGPARLQASRHGGGCRRALGDNRTRRPGLGQPSCFVEVGRGSARRA